MAVHVNGAARQPRGGVGAGAGGGAAVPVPAAAGVRRPGAVPEPVPLRLQTGPRRTGHPRVNGPSTDGAVLVSGWPPVSAASGDQTFVAPPLVYLDPRGGRGPLTHPPKSSSQLTPNHPSREAISLQTTQVVKPTHSKPPESSSQLTPNHPSHHTKAPHSSRLPGPRAGRPEFITPAIATSSSTCQTVGY